MSHRQLRGAVIGLGVGQRHANCYARLPGVDLVAVCDIQPALAVEVAARHECTPFFDAGELYRAARPDVVSVCTPPATHAEISLAGIASGAHVLVEKPMAPSLDDCAAMIDAARSANVTLMLGHRKRFAPPFARLYDLTSEGGPLGRIRFVSVRYMWGGVPSNDWFWREDDGGGPLLDSHVHIADTLGYLVGEPQSVHVDGRSGYGGSPTGSVAIVAYTARFGGRQQSDDVVVSTSYGMVGPVPPRPLCDEVWYFVCDNGVAEITGPLEHPERLCWTQRRHPHGEVQREEWPDADICLLQIDHFLDCVRSGGSPRAHGEAGLRAVAFCLAVKESAATGLMVSFPNGHRPAMAGDGASCATVS